MKLYYSPGACSIGIHALLEEIGKPYQLEPVNLREGAQFKPPYTAVKPEGEGSGSRAGRRLGLDRIPGDRPLARKAGESAAEG